MTDEPDEELGDVESVEPTDSEAYDTAVGVTILPHGAQWYAETFGVAALRIVDKTGDIEVQDVETGEWHKPSNTNRTAKISVIRGKP